MFEASVKRVSSIVTTFPFISLNEEETTQIYLQTKLNNLSEIIILLALQIISQAHTHAQITKPKNKIPSRRSEAGEKSQSIVRPLWTKR